jgi:divalent metal cation (Fe/Co/Zn/Cd) transporter
VIWNDAVLKIALQSKPDASLFGVGVALASLAIMPWVARMEAQLARQLRSAALAAESRETLVCAWLSVALLFGLGANVLFGWWWADPVVAMLMTALIAREGWEAIRGRDLLHHNHGQTAEPESG